jgi:leader peptidase (prepilin peptidase) / N-methyltransferase
MISAFAATAALPWFLPALAFVLGAIIGSFLNVVIIRLPAEKSVVTPGSHCACGQPIAWRDNIPILSWLLLRGRARCCGRPFSIRYPIIELLTALLFVCCARQFAPAVMVCGWVLVSALIAATFIDVDTLSIPDTFTIGLAAAGLPLSLLVPALHGEHSGFFGLDSLRSGADALEGLLIGSGLVLWIAMLGEAVLKKEALGFGDVKFVGAIGAFCGWHGAVFSVFGGAVAGTLWILAAMVKTKAESGKRKAETGEPAKPPLGFGMQVPFGPMLAFAGAAYFLFLHGPVDAWFARFSDLF